MAVPNNYSFKLSDVVDEIPGGQSSLQECFNESTDSLFDPDYKGSKNSLRNFRNYGVSTFIPTINVVPSSISGVGSGGQLVQINIYSNTSWTVSSNYGRASPTTRRGNGNQSIGIDIGPNITGSPVNIIITVTTTASGASNVSDTVSISQLWDFPY